ncbi:MAG: LytTR family DNA-binding domain-containing protein [Bacteroidia bacterium]
MSRSFSCIILDDDNASLKHVLPVLDRVAGFNCLAYCRDANEARPVLQQSCVDWMLVGPHARFDGHLDALLPDCPGPWMTYLVQEGTRQMALSGSENKITAPVSLPALLRCYEGLLERQTRNGQLEPHDDQMIVKLDSGMRGLELSRIQLVEAMADYVRIHCQERRYTVYGSMKSIMDQLPEWRFARVHRSFIVNLAQVDRVSRSSFQLLNGQTIPIGITYRKGLLEFLGDS